MRFALLAFAALCVGAMAGVLGVHLYVAPELDKTATDLAALRHEHAALEQRATESSAAVKRLEDENSNLAQQRDEALQQLKTETAQVDLLSAAQADALAAPEPLAAPADSERRPRNNGRRMRDFGPGGLGGPPAPDGAPADGADAPQPTDRRQQMQEMRDRMRNNVMDTIAQEKASLTDPKAIERLGALQQYFDANMGLLDELAAAETDEEREAIRDALAQNQGTVRQLMREQQEFTLREVAAQHGVTSTDQQQAFANDALEAMQSPMFNMGRFMGGGAMFGRGGRGGGSRPNSAGNQ